MEFLQFIFKDGFHFFGTMILIWVIGDGIADIIRAFSKRIEITNNSYE